MPIVELRMILRDTHTLNWLRERLREGRGSVSYVEIADALDCHPNTARNVIQRLMRAGLIELETDNHPGRGANVYRLPDED